MNRFVLSPVSRVRYSLLTVLTHTKHEVDKFIVCVQNYDNS